MNQKIIKEVIAILEKEEYLVRGEYKQTRTEGVEKAIAKLRSIKASEPSKWEVFVEHLELNQKQYCLEYDDRHIANLTEEQYESFKELLCKAPEQPPAGKFTKEMREQIAELCHEQWSGWIRYMFGKCNATTLLGKLIIPEWGVRKWNQQSCTPYNKLTPKEQDSDRTEADKFISLTRDIIDTSEAIKVDLLEACEAMKLRIHFIGLPSEPMNEDGPDWSKEIVLLEAAIAKGREER